MSKDRVHRQADVLGDLPEQDGGNVAIGVERHSGCPAIRMPILLVGPALPRLDEAKAFQYGDHFPGLQDRD